MKKIILSGLLLGGCFMLASCGTTGEDAAIKNLANQVDRLNNVVANASVVDTKTIDLENYSNGEGEQSAIRNIYQKTRTSIDNQNSYKNKILEKTASIKQSLSSNELKIGNKNVKAMRELSSTLSKYTNKLANTNNEYKKTAKSVAKLKNNQNTSSSVLGAKLTRLSSCADSRSCYYNNILNTLSQIEIILNNGAVVQNNVLENNVNQNDFNNQNDSTLYNNCDNGVCYDKNGNVVNGSYFDNKGNLVNNNTPANNNYVNNTNQNFNAPQYNNNVYRNRYPQNAGTNNNYYRNNGLNPDRNTDTYAPNISNIDTYRHNGGYGNYANMTQTETTSTEKEETKNDTKDIKEDLNKEIQTLEEKVNNIVQDTAEPKQQQETKKDSQVAKTTIINMNEDGKNDKNPRTENLRFEKPIQETQKLTSKTTEENTLNIGKDYKSSNKKIKDLIQSSAPINENSFFNVI